MAGSADWTEAKIATLLAERYAGHEWAFFRGVPNGTGMARSRICDGMAMGLWPSKGLYLHGFEIKVSRSDWLREIQEPAKAEAFAQFCHYWWIVAPPGIVELPEMAGDWGLLVPAGNGLRVKKAAQIREPKPLDMPMLAAILRVALRDSPEQAVMSSERQAGYDAGLKAGLERGARSAKSENTVELAELRRLKQRVEEFQAASGIKIDAWTDGRAIGEAVVLVKDARLQTIQRVMEEANRWAERVASGAKDAITKLDEACAIAQPSDR